MNRAFYKRRQPQQIQEVVAYETALREFVHEMALLLRKSVAETVAVLEQRGLIHPLESAYLQGMVTAWGGLD